MELGYILSSTQGRISRGEWWLGLLVLVIVGVVLAGVIYLAFGTTTMAVVATLILQVLLLYPSYALSAKRFQDRDKPGGLALIGIGLAIVQTIARLAGLSDPVAPTAVDYVLGVALLIVGIWYLVELGILRGTVGPNAHGADPLERR